jgi:hypothetical protein
VKESEEFPETKADLLDYWKNGTARQFHETFWSPGHAATNYDT